MRLVTRPELTLGDGFKRPNHLTQRCKERKEEMEPADDHAFLCASAPLREFLR